MRQLPLAVNPPGLPPSITFTFSNLSSTILAPCARSIHNSLSPILSLCRHGSGSIYVYKQGCLNCYMREALLEAILRIVAEGKKIEVLGNLISFKGYSCFSEVSEDKHTVSVKEFVRYFGNKSSKMTAKSLAELFMYLYGSDVIGEERFTSIFKPILLQDTPITKSHQITQPPQSLIVLHLQSHLRKMQLKQKLFDFIRKPANLVIFKNEFCDKQGNVELKKMIGLFDSVKMSKLEFQLFIVEFFEEEKVPLKEFCGGGEERQTVTTVASGKEVSGKQRSDRREDILPKNIVELFCSFILLISEHLPEIKRRTKQFMLDYQQIAFQQRISELYVQALKNIDSRLTDKFLRSQSYQHYSHYNKDLDMKQFLHMISLLRLQVSNISLRILFCHLQSAGLLNISHLYNYLCLGAPRQSASTNNKGNSLQQLLTLLLKLEQNLQQIRQRIGSRSSNYLVHLFNSIAEEDDFDLQMLMDFVNRYSTKQVSKNSMRAVWDRVFGKDRVELREFAKAFMKSMSRLDASSWIMPTECSNNDKLIIKLNVTIIRFISQMQYPSKRKQNIQSAQNQFPNLPRVFRLSSDTLTIFLIECL